MKIIETNGITYLEKFDSSAEWYWGSDYIHGDLYEAEELVSMGKKLTPNRVIFVHYPDGKVYEPIILKNNQYFGRPAYIDGTIYLLLVSFNEKMIRVYQCSNDMYEVTLMVEIPLSVVKDCYNLKLDGSPLMITRQGGDDKFQIIWPEKIEFDMGVRESFVYREENKLYFSEWQEDPEYREELNVREYPTGKLLEKIPGTEMTLPDGQSWILR